MLASSRSWPRASTPNVKPPKPPGTTILMKKASQRFTALHQRPHTVTHEHNHCAMNDETALSALETRAHAHVHAHTHTQHAHTNSIQALHLSQKLGWSMTASVQLVIVNNLNPTITSFTVHVALDTYRVSFVLIYQQTLTPLFLHPPGLSGEVWGASCFS